MRAKARTLDAHLSARLSFHQALQGGLSPSDGRPLFLGLGRFGVAGESSGRRKFTAKVDGEIKAPGPFWSMALMVLEIFRDRVAREGPGFKSFRRENRGLSGTWLSADRTWSRLSH